MNELQTIQPEGGTVAQITPMSMLSMAVSQNADIDKLKQLMELQERWEANEARKAFVSAMNAFKANPPEILKTKLVSFGNTRYKHAELGNVNAAIIDGLTQHGLSHRWTIDQQDGKITVSCVITHQQGHSESTSMTAQADTSGQKNAIQAIASTVTYLQRYTLLSATGIATQEDDDGMGGEKKPKFAPPIKSSTKPTETPSQSTQAIPEGDRLSTDQVIAMDDELKAGKVNKDRFLAAASKALNLAKPAISISQLPADFYTRAMAWIERAKNENSK